MNLRPMWLSPSGLTLGKAGLWGIRGASRAAPSTKS
jgi:hypothetical protein